MFGAKPIYSQMASPHFFGRPVAVDSLTGKESSSHLPPIKTIQHKDPGLAVDLFMLGHPSVSKGVIMLAINIY